MPNKSDVVRIDNGEDEYVTLRCKYHCIQCGRHFADERAFKAHFVTPANFGGCHKPTGVEGKFEIIVDKEGECRAYTAYSMKGDWIGTMRLDVRVYMSEDW